MTFSFEKKIILLFIISTGSIIIAGITTYTNNKVIRESNESLKRSHEVIYESEQVLYSVKNILAGSHEYVIIIDSLFEQALLESEEAILEHLDNLENLTYISVLQKQRVDTLKKLVNANIGFIFKRMELHKQKGFYEALKLEASGEGKIYMDGIIRIINAIQRTENYAMQKIIESSKKSSVAFERSFYMLLFTIIMLFTIVFIMVKRNLHLRKKAEEKLKEQNKELQKTNTELDRFVYSTSHDLRAPLTSMMGILEITEAETKDKFMLKHLSMLKDSIKKLDSFILDILDYSRNARLEVEEKEIYFKELLDGIKDNLKYMSEPNREVEIKVNIKNGVAFCSDERRISIVLNNLISNSIRYSNPESANPFVDVDVEISAEQAYIRIKDNGMGIAKEEQDKIFDMFYRVSKDSQGSGLGLYIVKETIEKLKGKIAIESELGKGTEFNIHIPNNYN